MPSFIQNTTIKCYENNGVMQLQFSLNGFSSASQKTLGKWSSHWSLQDQMLFWSYFHTNLLSQIHPWFDFIMSTDFQKLNLHLMPVYRCNEMEKRKKEQQLLRALLAIKCKIISTSVPVEKQSSKQSVFSLKKKKSPPSQDCIGQGRNRTIATQSERTWATMEEYATPAYRSSQWSCAHTFRCSESPVRKVIFYILTR